MDYEKAYKDAVSKIKSIIADKKKQGLTNCLLEGDLNEIFPELKESEDKKIRKEIIEYLEERQIIEKLSETKVKKNWIAWLEKQGEQKPVNENLKDTEETMMYQGEVYTRVYKDELDKFANKYPKTIPHSSKKYAKYSDTDLVIAVKAGAEWQMKQKPAWSEEDEEFISILIERINQLYVVSEKLCKYEDRDRLDPKHKDWLIEKIKSLKPQPHWKPTNRQLNVLQTAIKDYGICREKNVLESLYNDIIKL